jgi:cytochrome c oxidase cbb3-type subunit 1
MDWFVKSFIRASLLWFAAGILLGVGMTLEPSWIIYRPAHAHMNVAGFLSMLVFGVGYHLLPRLFGHPLYSPRLAGIHLFLANVGLLGLVGGFLLQPHQPTAGRWATVGGGLLFALGTGLWLWNLWRTFDAAEAAQRARAQAGTRGLPTVDR